MTPLSLSTYNLNTSPRAQSKSGRFEVVARRIARLVNEGYLSIQSYPRLRNSLLFAVLVASIVYIASRYFTHRPPPSQPQTVIRNQFLINGRILESIEDDGTNSRYICVKTGYQIVIHVTSYSGIDIPQDYIKRRFGSITLLRHLADNSKKASDNTDSVTTIPPLHSRISIPNIKISIATTPINIDSSGYSLTPPNLTRGIREVLDAKTWEILFDLASFQNAHTVR